MSIAEVLLHPRLWAALAVYAALSLLAAWAGHRLAAAIADQPLGEWIGARVVLPALRVLALLGFMLIAYPVLFGLAEAVPVRELLADPGDRVNKLLSLAFVAAIALPLLPVIGAIEALILPLQAAAASALLFHWLAGPGVSLWPTPGVVGAMLLWALLTHLIATLVLKRLGYGIDEALFVQGSGALLYDALLLLFQVPAILIYSTSLGPRLTG